MQLGVVVTSPMNNVKTLIIALLLAMWTRAGVAGCRGALGEYGFISSAVLGPQSEAEARARVATMAREYGIREFMFYDWSADYSMPVRGSEWTDAYFRRHPISRETIRIALDEIHRQGGRGWAYVQALAAEEDNLESPSKDIWKLRTAKGEWYWHPNSDHPRFPTYLPNAAWARLMAGRWAPAVKQLGFDGIHWDTLGRIAGDPKAEAIGIQDFLKTACGLLERQGLLQTMNFVDLQGWDRQTVLTCCEFPYAEVWSDAVKEKYFQEMAAPEMHGVRGVWAMYPTTVKPAEMTETKILADRHADAVLHNLAFVLVGDGARRMRTEYWPATVPLNEAEHLLLRVNKDK